MLSGSHQGHLSVVVGAEAAVAQYQRQLAQRRRDFMSVLQRAALEVEQQNPCLGTCCSEAVGRLEIPDDALQGTRLLPETVLTLVVCLVGRQALARASTMCGIHLAGTRPAMKSQLWLVEQLEALPAEQRAAFLEALAMLVSAGNEYGRAPLRLA